MSTIRIGRRSCNRHIHSVAEPVRLDSPDALGSPGNGRAALVSPHALLT